MRINFECLIFLTTIYSVGNAKLIADVQRAWTYQTINQCDLTGQPQCSYDCSAVLECVAGIKTPVRAVKCQSTTPFCDKGVCSYIPGSCSLNNKLLNFVCTSEGVFPDATDCTKYHHCSESGISSTVLECPSGNIYNSKLKVCQRRLPKIWHHSLSRVCEKVDCDGKRNEFVPLQTNPAFYAFCSVSKYGVKKIFIYKCANEETYKFDSLSRRCIFSCPSAGYFADSYNCNAYYICSGYRTFTAQRMTCPAEFYFNENVCVNSTTHCPSGSISNTPKPIQLESSTSAVSSTIDQTAVETTQSSQSSEQLSASSTSASSSTIGPTAAEPSQSSQSSEQLPATESATLSSVVTTSSEPQAQSSTVLPEFNCTSAGYYADSSDCSKYYICNGRRTFTAHHMSCPTGFYFNGSACVNSDKYCQPGTVINTSKPTLLESSQSSGQSSSTESQSVPTVTQSSTGAQSTETQAVIPELNCQSAGYYADSNNCSVYYICSGEQALPCKRKSCSFGFYFYRGTCVNSSEHCELGSVIVAPNPALLESATSAQTSMEQAAEETLSSTQISQTTTESSPETTSMSNFYAYYPSILFLPCPLWLDYSDDLICSNIGSYINYGDQKKRLRGKSSKLGNFTPLLKQSSTVLQSAEPLAASQSLTISPSTESQSYSLNILQFEEYQASSKVKSVLRSTESYAALPEFNCQSTGYYADSNNCSVYYICNGHQTLPCERKSCPSGLYFYEGTCVKSPERCALEAITNTSKPALMDSSTSAQSTTTEQEQSAEGVTESTSMSPADATSNFYSYYPNILFLPCPLWLESTDDHICSNIGSYINYGDQKKKLKRKSSQLNNLTPLLKIVLLTKVHKSNLYKSSKNSPPFSSLKNLLDN